MQLESNVVGEHTEGSIVIILSELYVSYAFDWKM